MTRFIVAGVAAALGLWLIYVGLTNMRTRTSEETGVRRRVNRAMDEGNTYAGAKAALQGWIRIGLGIAAIVFAVWFSSSARRRRSLRRIAESGSGGSRMLRTWRHLR